MTGRICSPSPGPALTPEERDRLMILQMRLEGQTLQEIAATFKISRAKVRRILSEQGVR